MKIAREKTPLKISETKILAENLLQKIAGSAEGLPAGAGLGERAGALVIGLYGDLGAGKTTFMQFFAAGLGVKEKILSPTFVIEKIYKIAGAGVPDAASVAANFDHLIHIDAYRLENPEEILTLGWAEIVKNPRNIICVEWADRIASLLPADAIAIRFAHHDEESRVIAID